MRAKLLLSLLMVSGLAFSLQAIAEVSDFIRGEPRLTVSRSGNAARITSNYDGEWVKMYVQRGNDIYVVTHSTRQQQWRSRQLGPDAAAYVRQHLAQYLFPSDTEFTVRAGGRTQHFNWEEGEWADQQSSSSGSSGGSSSGADREDQDDSPVDRGGNQHAGSDPLCRLAGTCGGSSGGSGSGGGSSSSGANGGSSSSTSSSSSSSSSGGSSSSTSSSSGANTSGGVVRSFAPRSVMHPKGVTGENGGGGLIENIQIPPADQYYLDYTVKFRSPFDWHGDPRGGKLPGLAGGTGTGGCRNIEPDGWSARQVWHKGGEARLYLYHQDRGTGCGDPTTWKNPNGSTFTFQQDRVYRITQRVKVNTPNQPNGEDQVWVDGVQVAYRNNIRFRGAVDPSVARVSMLKYHSYFGGKAPFAPDYDSYIDYGGLYVMSCAPDFAKAAGTCK